MVAALLQSLINGALKRAGGSAPLARFSGKRLLLSLLPLNLNLLLQADGQGVSLSRVAADTTTADCQLWLDHGALPLLHDPQQLGPLLAAGHVRLQGDAELAAELLRSLRQQGVNGEELLAGVVGDPLAHLLWRTGRQLQQRLPRQLTELGDSLGLWLRDEQRQLVAAAEWRPHARAVDQLAAAVAAAEARLARLGGR